MSVDPQARFAGYLTDVKHRTPLAAACNLAAECGSEAPNVGTGHGPPSHGRFASVDHVKAQGKTYTPGDLATYLANQVLRVAQHILEQPSLAILDPAIGDGALALALLSQITRSCSASLSLTGYETNQTAAQAAQLAIASSYPQVRLTVHKSSFLAAREPQVFDLAIANPPYVRTQILGAAHARALSRRFALKGRVDLYQAFALALVDRLSPNGVLGLLTSNRFLTTKGAGAFRTQLAQRLSITHVWDLGDTKVFQAAVLPAIVVGRKKAAQAAPVAPQPSFTSIYARASLPADGECTLTEALDRQGRFRIGARSFEVTQGHLQVTPAGIWRLTSNEREHWLATVRSNTWRELGEIGRVRVGVKSTADRVFIRDDWASMGDDTPELLRPVMTHHVAARYRCRTPARHILYPHADTARGRGAIDLAAYPKSQAYLEAHRKVLMGRSYVTQAGRNWYELWVPHQPLLWLRPKLVFRDIAAQPTFWLDLSGAIVNGDCYWMVTDDSVSPEMLWLALAVTNSTFTEMYYDHSFNNKLYAGRRRFMTQYVSQLPLPAPTRRTSQDLIALAKLRYDAASVTAQAELEHQIDGLVWAAFGVTANR